MYAIYNALAIFAGFQSFKLTFLWGEHKWFTHNINWNKSCKKHTWHLLAGGSSTRRKANYINFSLCVLDYSYSHIRTLWPQVHTLKHRIAISAPL